jgi:hypothetical protein
MQGELIMNTFDVRMRARLGSRSMVVLSLLILATALLAAVPSSAAPEKSTLHQEAVALVTAGFRASSC